MAGGMSNRRGESLAERVAATRRREAAELQSTPPAASAQPAAPPVRHCWYDGPHGRQAALLLQWRNLGGRYDGRIAVVVPSDEGWVTAEMWVDGAMLSRA